VPGLRALGHAVSQISLDELGEAGAARFPTLVLVPDREAASLDTNKLQVRFERALGAVDARLVVFVSSAAAYEPNHHHPGLATEGQLSAQRFGNAVTRRWRSLEGAVRTAVAERVPLVVLRPPAIPLPDGKDFFSQLFHRRWALVLPGHDPSLQLFALEDLSRAISLVVAEARSGVYNLAPRHVIPLRRALRRAGVLAIPVPRWMQALGRRILRWISSSVHPVSDLDFIRFSWTVSGDRIRKELGFEPELSSAEALAGSGESEAPDDFGLDTGYIESWSRTALRFLHNVYWRVEVEGLEHIPRTGPVALAGVHRGWVPLDAVLAVDEVFRRTGRVPRFLVHPGLLRFPFFFDFITRFGGILACRENVDRILDEGGILGVFPEGVRGPFRLYRNAYRLGRFGNDEFLRAALRHRAAVVPFVTVGSAEAFPIVAKIEWRWWRRWTEWPFLPVAPTLLPVPLPSKWHTRFLPPVPEMLDLPPEAAEDPETVGSLSLRIREVLGREMESIRRSRPGVFHGSVFAHPSTDGPADGPQQSQSTPPNREEGPDS